MVGEGRACLVGRKDETGNIGGGFWYCAAAGVTTGLGCCVGFGMFANIDEAGSISD